MAPRLFAAALLCSFACGAAAAVASPAECAARTPVVDSAVDNMTMVISENVNGYPTMDDFVNEYCSPFPDWFRDLNSYKPCLKAFTRTLYAFVATNIKKIYKEFCTSDEKKLIAFNHLTCFNPESKPVFMDIGAKVKTFAYYIADLPDIDDIIPVFCCGYLNVTVTLTEQVERDCARQGKVGSGVFIGKIVKALFADAVDFICGRYQTSADCSTPKLTGAMDAMVEKQKLKTVFKHKSLVLPVLDVFARLDSKINVD